jgi:hypothetical protein
MAPQAAQLDDAKKTAAADGVRERHIGYKKRVACVTR